MILLSAAVCLYEHGSGCLCPDQSGREQLLSSDQTCPIGISCHTAGSLIDASCFWGAIMVPKCQELICGFIMWTHGPRRGPDLGPLGELEKFAQQMWEGLRKKVWGWGRAFRRCEVYCQRSRMTAEMLKITIFWHEWKYCHDNIHETDLSYFAHWC